MSQVAVLYGPTMEDRMDHVQRARLILEYPDMHSRLVLRDAAETLAAWGDVNDLVIADAMLDRLNAPKPAKPHLGSLALIGLGFSVGCALMLVLAHG